MDFLWSNFRLAMLLSGISCAVCGVYVLRRPGAVGRVGLAAALFGAAVWGLAYGVELGSVGSERVLWGALKYAGIVLLPDGPTRAVAQLAALPQPFTASEARQALGTTRRVAIPLLEHLDARGATRRVDDSRRTVVRPAG